MVHVGVLVMEHVHLVFIACPGLQLERATLLIERKVFDVNATIAPENVGKHPGDETVRAHIDQIVVTLSAVGYVGTVEEDYVWCPDVLRR